MENLNYVKERFEGCFDVKYRDVKTIIGDGTLVFIDDLCNGQWMMEYLILPLRGFGQLKGTSIKTPNDLLEKVLDISATGVAKDLDDALMHVLSGDAILVLKDFSEIINKALELGGYDKDQEPHEILVGFGHHATLSNAETIVNAVKDGKIRHFFLIGGCDGARPGRNYYTEFAKMVPDDCIILTLACGKYRFNKLEFGEVAGLPRLLDVGQCNDAYSAVRIATALADTFGTDVNGLPLSLIISWYEQKAVADLLALLSLGIKGIFLGPTLPAFLSPNVAKVLVENFGIGGITNVEDDMKMFLE